MVSAAIADADMESIVRTVTDEEVEHYIEYGWVMLRKLVDPAFAADLLKSALDLGKAAGRELVENQPALRGDEPFRSFMYSQRMVENATRLVNRKRLKGVDVPMRYREDFMIKKPAGQDDMPRPSTTSGYHPEYGTGFHQDSSEHGSDRVGELQFWLALKECTPEMGPMRFVNRSHREGPLGSVFNQDDDDLGGVRGHFGNGNLLDQYPRLPEVLGMSEPLETHYMPGDATVHHGYCVHGSINNSSDHDRWSYLFSYSPADTRYWEGDCNNNQGHNRTRATSERNPVVFYPPPLGKGIVADVARREGEAKL